MTVSQKAEASKPPRLEMHVLGAGKGESIILGWPNNRWGVVDCYAPTLNDPTTNPTLQFLRERNITALEFLCLTHPHDDHFRGMSHLLDNLIVKEFWRFPGLAAAQLWQVAQYMQYEADDQENPEVAEQASEFARIIGEVNARVRNRSLVVKLINGHQQVYPTPYDTSAWFQVWSFAPHTNQVANYEMNLAASFDEQNIIRPHPPHVSHNSISIGLIVKFGKTRIILGGDVERAAWTDVLADHENSPEHFFADVVKVSHHGSDTGIAPGLWARFAGGSKPIAVIAPYSRFRLPKREPLQEIKEHARTVLLTCPAKGAYVPCSTAPNLESRAALRAEWRASDQLPPPRCGSWSFYFTEAGLERTQGNREAVSLELEKSDT